VIPSWVTKTDPVKHPVRFLASIWQERMKVNFSMAGRPFTDKEYGQLKTLRLHLGDFTQPLIEWIVDPVNWWLFCQEVRKRWKTIFVPEYPHIGFLLLRRGVALRVMRSKLRNTTEGTEFIKKLDDKEYQELRALALVYAAGDPIRLAKVEAAKTLTDIRNVLNEMFDDSNH
jgi:hypothetical protein